MKILCSTLLFAFAVSRLGAADFTVTNPNNSRPGSLYQAITDANATPGADRVLFNIPGAGVHMIDVSANPLPTVLESLTIDGYSQPGAPSDDREAAILYYVPVSNVGAYTAIVRGANGSTGVALVEVYALN